jgi:uncharacterized membrane protein YeaQ/YmgE (transglycosylase-associated protein family)
MEASNRRKHTMSPLIWTILIGIIAGWLAGQIMKGGGYGLVGDLILGILGAWFGGWIFRILGLAGGGLIGQIVVSTIGAVALVAIVRAIKKA